MLTVRVLATAAVSAALMLAFSPIAQAADLAVYRGLRLGMTMVAAGKTPGTVPGEAAVTHKRPALLQELHWRPGSTTSDSVQEAVLSFYNGELSRIVVTYDRYRVEGLTAQDMMDGISRIYGTASTPKVEIPFHSIYGESAAVIGRWQEADSSWSLVRTGDGTSFALVGLSGRLDALTQAAVKEAERLDAAEAPQREAARQAKRDADESSARDKARSNNKSSFQP